MILIVKTFKIGYNSIVNMKRGRNMIRNNLSLLLTERNLKITKVSNDTNISRTTLTALNQNDNKMIQMETINTLCKYLKITHCEFFEYTPIDATYTFYLGEILTSQKALDCGTPFEIEAIGYINFTRYDTSIGSVEFNGRMIDRGPIGYITSDKYIYEYEVQLSPVSDLNKYFNELSIPFQTQLKEEFIAFVEKQLEKEDEKKNIDYSKSYKLTVKFE